jgi:hypothetical protein
MNEHERTETMTQTQNARDKGRIILAYGEVTGHCHEVLTETLTVPTFEQAQFFVGPDGTRELIVLEPCALVHEEHGRIALDPAVPRQVRQGDVLLHPTGPGTWRVIQQQEWAGPEVWRAVAD